MIANLQNADDAVNVVTSTVPIETFIMNGKANQLAILQTDKQCVMYRLTTTTKIETSFNDVKWAPSQAAFLHLDALWLIDLTSSDNSLTFDIYPMKTNGTSSKLITKLNGKFNQLEISKYVQIDDKLYCAMIHSKGIMLCHLTISMNDVDCVKISHYEGFKITKLISNCNNDRIAFCTDKNVIYVIEGDHESTWPVKSQLEIQTISFDPNMDRTLCIITETIIIILYLVPNEKLLMVLECISTKSFDSAVSIAIPNVYMVDRGSLYIKESIELRRIEEYRETITSMFQLDRKKFVKQLHQCQFDDKNMWMTLAKRCLHQGDIESAIYCAAKNGDARLVRALRHEMSVKGKHVDALLAINLNLTVEGERLLKDDPNELSRLYQLQNEWNDAFYHADKIQIKSSHYDYARHLEGEHKINEAIKYYELSGNVLEIPRMLFETRNISQLEDYCLKSRKKDSKSSSLVTWWGQYCESQGDHKTAIEMYENVSDHYNLVRLMCHVGQTEKAILIVNQYMNSNESTPPNKEMTAAMLYLGKHLESLNGTESIHYYLNCGAVRHAIRVCIANELYDELAIVAVEHCSPNESRHILEIYCRPNRELINEETMVKLMYKCSLVHEAIVFAFDNHLWTQLRFICQQELSRETRDFLIGDQILEMALQALKNDSTLIDIVIDLIIMSSPDNFSLITQTVRDYGINVDDQLMEKLEQYTTNNQNKTLVDTFAELCLEKGNYQLAAKLYNKIGKRVDSLKALIRSDNVEKVIQFANVARDKMVFKLAANYLQTINHTDTNLIKKFYTKAEAYQELDRYTNELETMKQ